MLNKQMERFLEFNLYKHFSLLANFAGDIL